MNTVKLIEKNSYSMRVFELEAPEIGDRFVVRVSLPGSFGTAPDRRYPVLYVLDGDAALGAAVSTLDYINLGGNFGLGKNVPELIVVGIGYERGPLPWLFTRVRDFTPTADPSFNYNNPAFSIPASGGAEAFYEFLTRSVMPAVASEFPVDPSLALLSGHSMGALFALYAMLKDDTPFHKYIAMSPFIGWDGGVLFKLQAAHAAAGKALRADLALSCCGIEPTPTYIQEVREYRNALEGRACAGLRCLYKEYPEENHFSVLPKAFSEGLYALFA